LPTLLLQFFSLALIAQVQISGRVTTADNKGIPDISVLVRNTTFGSTTDADGSYSFQANLKPGTYQLDFTGVGYKMFTQNIQVNASGNVSANAQLVLDALKMDEVVVTGTLTGTSRRQVGNAITTINASQLQNSGASNLSAILNGRVMGAQVTQNSGDPAGGISIKLRGVGSIFGSSEPLYIVDGVIIDNSSANVINLSADAQGARIQGGTNRLVDINPNDIERIEVINGAAASAIYGSRASNGVVQIFTKRGKSGKPQVSFTTSINHNSLRKRLEFNDYPFRFGIQQDPRLFAVGDRLTMVGNFRPVPNSNPGTGPRAAGNDRLDETKYPVTRYDYQDDIFENSLGTDNHISVSGGSDMASFYLSGSYLKNQGIIKNTNFQRYGLRARTDIALNRWMKVSGGTLFTNSRSKDMPNGNNFFSPVSTMTIIDNVWDINERDADGNLKHVEIQRVNPLSVIETFDLRQEINRNLTDVKLNLTPVTGLSIDLTTGFDTYAQQGFEFHPRLPYPGVAAGFFPDGYVANAKYNYYQWTGDAVASYKFHIVSNLQSTTSAGFASQYIKTAYSAQEGRDLIPFVKTISAAQNFFAPSVDTRTEQSIYGLFAQQSFGFRDRLFLTLAGRIDGSSAFGKDARNNFYPKASLSYNISDEDFWKNGLGTVLNTVKLRASYGKAGNLTGIGAYDRFITYLPITYTGGGFAPRNQIGNVNIKPEVKTEWEAGADMGLINGRLGIQFTVYDQRIKDLVIPFNIAPSNGASSLVDNLGKMTNKGFEVLLTGSPVKTSSLQWDLSILFNHNKNEITELYKSAGFIGFDAGATQGVLLGHPAGVYYVNYYARNADGSLLLKDVNGFKLPQIERGTVATDEKGHLVETPQRDANGQPVGTPLRKVLGDPNPDYTATLATDLNYKNWGLRIQFDRVAGFEVYNWDWITRNNVGNGTLAERELKGELPRGWVAAIGGFIGPRIQEEHVQDGTFTKLREVALSYTLNKLKFAQSVKLSLVGRNLLSFDNYNGFDPEISSAGQSIVRGDDFGAFPIPRVVQFSITTNF
jgi:TonB-linked SusC/RagA family outer membrane protein